jgi:hypothetical protein
MSGIVSADPGDGPVPQPGGGWISGPATSPPPVDNRPEFNPSFLVHEILRVLREHRLDVDPNPGQIRVAELSAGDFLRAIGVRPASAPMRP